MVKNLTANAGDIRHRFDTWVRKSPKERHGDLLQYFYLENPMDRGDWRAIDHRVTKSWTQLKQLSMQALSKTPIQGQCYSDLDCIKVFPILSASI